MNLASSHLTRKMKQNDAYFSDLFPSLFIESFKIWSFLGVR